jgi:hypothetical protein
MEARASKTTVTKLELGNQRKIPSFFVKREAGASKMEILKPELGNQRNL